MKIIYRALYILIALAALAIGGLIYLYAFDGDPPVVFTGDPGATDKAVYHVGDTVRVHREVCQANNIDGTLHWVLVGTKHVYPLPDSARPHTPGCKSVDVSAFVVAPTMESDVYYIDARIDFDVNPIRTRTVAWRSQEFEIVVP